MAIIRPDSTIIIEDIRKISTICAVVGIENIKWFDGGKKPEPPKEPQSPYINEPIWC